MPPSGNEKVDFVEFSARMEEWQDRIWVHTCHERLILGILFLQPDMLDSNRVSEPDFEASVGSAIILLEYRVQQSPKTRLYDATRCGIGS